MVRQLDYCEAFMLMFWKTIVFIGMGALLSSCLTKPTFNLWDSSKQDPPPGVGDLVRHIQCELYLAIQPLTGEQLTNLTKEQMLQFDQAQEIIRKLEVKPTRTPEENTQLDQAQEIIRKLEEQAHLTPEQKIHRSRAQQIGEGGYIAYATLTLDVWDFEGTAPNLAYGFSRFLNSNSTYTALSVSGLWTGTQHRNANYTFTIALDHPVDSAQASDSGCKKQTANSERALHGSLGLATILNAGLILDPTKRPLDRPEDVFLFEVPEGIPGDKKNTQGTQINHAPVFGSTVDFTIVYGFSGLGPTWNLNHFKGPGPGNTPSSASGGGGGGAGLGANGTGGAAAAPGLLSLNRTDKDTLVISFAPVCPNHREGDICTHNAAGFSMADFSAAVQSEKIETATTSYQILLNAFAATTNLLQANSAEEQAVKAAKDNNTALILQNLFSN